MDKINCFAPVLCSIPKPSHAASFAAMAWSRLDVAGWNSKRNNGDPRVSCRLVAITSLIAMRLLRLVQWWRGASLVVYRSVARVEMDREQPRLTGRSLAQ